MIKRQAWRVLVVVLIFALSASSAASAKTLVVSGILAWFAGDSIMAGAQRFLEEHPDVEIVFHGAGPGDVLVAILGGSPPDVIGLPAGALPSWAVQGLVLPLTQYAERDGVRAADFIPPAWYDVTYEGELWGLPLIVDPVYGLLRNKRLFSEAGLDRDVPPATIQELDDLFPKLTKYNSEGRLEQLAMAHWPIHEDGNTLYTWGFAFGGEFVDYATGEITAHHPANVAALEWLLDYYNRYDGDFLELERSIFGGQEADIWTLFAYGRLAMAPSLPADARTVLNIRADLELGISDPIYHQDAQPHPTWLGGWSIAIPRGVSDPELAWEFIRTIAATEEGTAAFSRVHNWLTAYIPSPYWQEAMSDPLTAPYIDIALKARNTRPRIPANEFYARQIVEAMTDLYERRAFSAREVLERVSRRVQEEMDRILGSR